MLGSLEGDAAVNSEKRVRFKAFVCDSMNMMRVLTNQLVAKKLLIAEHK